MIFLCVLRVLGGFKTLSSYQLVDSVTIKGMYPYSRQPRPFLVPFRILLITSLATLLSFAISMFLGILGTVAWAALHHTNPNLTAVYRHFAPPIAIVIGVVVLIAATIHEIRYYRQAKALAAIERLSFR